MHISNNRYRLGQLTRDRVEPAARLLAKNFLNQNDIWATAKPTEEEGYRFMYDKTTEMLDWEDELREEGIIAKDVFINVVYIDEEDNIIGVATSFELTQYRRKVSKVDLPQFNMIERYGAELEKDIHPKDEIPGLNIYGMFSTLEKKLMSTGVTMLFWLDLTHHLYVQGFRTVYMRCSNPRTTANFVKAGGDLISSVEGIENGKKVKFQWVRYPCRPISMLYHVIDKYLERARL